MNTIDALSGRDVMQTNVISDLQKLYTLRTTRHEKNNIYIKLFIYNVLSNVWVRIIKDNKHTEGSITIDFCHYMCSCYPLEFRRYSEVFIHQHARRI